MKLVDITTELRRMVGWLLMSGIMEQKEEVSHAIDNSVKYLIT